MEVINDWPQTTIKWTEDVRWDDFVKEDFIEKHHCQNFAVIPTVSDNFALTVCYVGLSYYRTKNVITKCDIQLRYYSVKITKNNEDVTKWNINADSPC